MARIETSHFSDPGCPWAYSASPALAALHWRYGEQLRWRHVMIGLAEHAEQYERRGYTPLDMALAYRRFRARGMPYAYTPRTRVVATGLACRAVVATRLLRPELEWSVFRALQFAWFTTTLPLDEHEAIAAALRRVDGLDVAAVVDALDDAEVVAAYEAGRREARTAAGSPSELIGKTAVTDGPVRYTAPSLIFEAGGRRLEAGGFQPVEAYEICIANLEPRLERRDPPPDAAELLTAFPGGLTTREVAACLAEGNAAPDDEAAAEGLIALVDEGRVRGEPLGDGMLWRPALEHAVPVRRQQAAKGHAAGAA